MVMEKINAVALAAVIGRSSTWAYQKQNKCIVNGMKKEFVEKDLPLINNGLYTLGCEILSSLIEYNTDRENVINQIKELRKLISMEYLCVDMLKEKKTWMNSRMKARSKEGKACSFKEDDILRINMAAMQIANELKSIEMVLK